MPAALNRCALAGLTALALLSAPAEPAWADTTGELITAEDLFPLRFYLENEQYDRVEAEVQRLRSIDPGWQVPDDILTRTFGPDESAVWSALADGNVEAAQQALDRLQRDYPDYEPSSELTSEFQQVAGQQQMQTAMENRNWSGVVAAAESAPGIITCGRVDNVWSLAEAYARLGQADDAATVWAQTITLCRRYEIAVATIEKADAFVTQSALDDLIDEAIGTIGREDDFRDLQARLVAGREAGVGGPDGAPPDSAEDTDDTPASDQAVTATSPSPSPPQDAGEPRSLTTQPSAPPSADTTGAGGDLSAALAARDRRDYGRCLAATRGMDTASALLTRGWCLYEMDRPTEAQMAFAAVQDRSPTAQERTDSHFGELLSMLRRQLVDEAERRLVQVDLPPDFEADVSAEILAQKAILAYEAGQFQRALVLIDARSSLAPDRRDLSMIRGFALYDLGRLAEAGRVFTRLDTELSTPDSREGLRIVRASRN